MNAKHVIVALSFVLFVSLAANFFFIGMMMGTATLVETVEMAHVTEDKAGGNAAVAGHARTMDRQLRKALSEEDKQVLTRAMQTVKPELTHAKESLRTARRAVHEAMRAQPFDPAALQAALKEERARQSMILDLINQTRAEAAGAMSAEGRAALLAISNDMENAMDSLKN